MLLSNRLQKRRNRKNLQYNSRKISRQVRRWEKYRKGYDLSHLRTVGRGTGNFISGGDFRYFAEEAVRRHSFSMVSRHFHQSLELYFLLEGERFYFVEQDTYHMKEQMAILVDQNQIHKTCPAGNGKSHHRFLLQLEGEALSCLLKLCGFRGLLEFGEQYRGITCFRTANGNRCWSSWKR